MRDRGQIGITLSVSQKVEGEAHEEKRNGKMNDNHVLRMLRDESTF